MSFIPFLNYKPIVNSNDQKFGSQVLIKLRHFLENLDNLTPLAPIFSKEHYQERPPREATKNP